MELYLCLCFCFPTRHRNTNTLIISILSLVFGQNSTHRCQNRAQPTMDFIFKVFIFLSQCHIYPTCRNMDWNKNLKTAKKYKTSFQVCKLVKIQNDWFWLADLSHLYSKKLTHTTKIKHREILKNPAGICSLLFVLCDSFIACFYTTSKWVNHFHCK